jgi:hypothetical protein
VMNRPATLASFRAVVLPILVAGLVAGCGHHPITVPPGAQDVHVMVNGDMVDLQPATVRAGDVYLVIDNPGTSVSLVERKATPDESPGPLSDVELDRVAHGDIFHTQITCCFENGRFGNVGKLVVAPGNYVFVTGDPTALAEKSGGVIPQQSLAVLRVLP